MITIKVDTSALRRGLDALATKQLPFALALTLNQVALAGQAAERAAMAEDLDRPRPFTTQQGVRVKRARKSDLVAMVYIPSIQSRYLAPEIVGGSQVLNANKAVLRPIDQATDQYGNLPRGLLARLKGRKDVFIGAVHGVNGVWQRLANPKGPGRLRLLIRFSAPVQVKTRLPFGRTTLALAQATFGARLRGNLGAALRTAR